MPPPVETVEDLETYLTGGKTSRSTQDAASSLLPPPLESAPTRGRAWKNVEDIEDLEGYLSGGRRTAERALADLTVPPQEAPSFLRRAGQALTGGMLDIIRGESSERRDKRLDLATKREAYDGLVRQVALEEGLNPRLVHAVIQQESGYNPKAISPKGAKGLMQLMDDTAAGLGVKDAYDPEQNLRGGVRYLRQLLTQFGGDVRLALAAYNAGPDRVAEAGGIPNFPETQAYVKNVAGALGNESALIAATERPRRSAGQTALDLALGMLGLGPGPTQAFESRGPAVPLPRPLEEPEGGFTLPSGAPLTGFTGPQPVPGGEVATVKMATVTDPRLNQGKATNIPLLVPGQRDIEALLLPGKPGAAPFTQEQERIAVDHAVQRVKNGETIPSYPTIQDAILAARSESAVRGLLLSRGKQRFQAAEASQEFPEPVVIPGRDIHGIKPILPPGPVMTRGADGQPGNPAVVEGFAPPLPTLERPSPTTAGEYLNEPFAAAERLATDLTAGYKRGIAQTLRGIANVPMLARTIAQSSLGQAVARYIPEGGALNTFLEQKLREVAADIDPARPLQEQSIESRIVQSIGQAIPGFAEAMGYTSALGPVAGLAAMGAIHEADKGLAQATLSAVSNGLLGVALQQLHRTGLPLAAEVPVVGGIFGGGAYVETGDPLEALTQFIIGAGMAYVGGRSRMRSADEILRGEPWYFDEAPPETGGRPGDPGPGGRGSGGRRSRVSAEERRARMASFSPEEKASFATWLRSMHPDAVGRAGDEATRAYETGRRDLYTKALVNARDAGDFTRMRAVAEAWQRGDVVPPGFDIGAFHAEYGPKPPPASQGTPPPPGASSASSAGEAPRRPVSSQRPVETATVRVPEQPVRTTSPESVTGSEEIRPPTTPASPGRPSAENPVSPLTPVPGAVEETLPPPQAANAAEQLATMSDDEFERLFDEAVVQARPAEPLRLEERLTGGPLGPSSLPLALQRRVLAAVEGFPGRFSEALFQRRMNLGRERARSILIELERRGVMQRDGEAYRVIRDQAPSAPEALISLPPPPSFDTPQDDAPPVRPAPATFLGWQENVGGAPPIALWNLTEEIPGHVEGATVVTDTLRQAGYAVEEPAPPAQATPMATEPPAPPPLQQGSRVRYTSGGKEVTGTIRNLDGDEATVEVDQIAVIGGRLPIGRVEYVPVSRLQSESRESIKAVPPPLDRPPITDIYEAITVPLLRDIGEDVTSSAFIPNLATDLTRIVDKHLKLIPLRQGNIQARNALRAELQQTMLSPRYYGEIESLGTYYNSIIDSIMEIPALQRESPQETQGIPLPATQAATPFLRTVRAIYDRIVAGNPPNNNRELQAIGDVAYGSSRAAGGYTPKDLSDAVEAALIQYVGNNPRHFNPQLHLAQALDIVQELETLLMQLPTHSVRTSEEDALQQFSTPIHYAYAAAWIANPFQSPVLEPSAGTGSLAIFLKNAFGADNVYVNDIDPRRIEALRAMGFSHVTTEDALYLYSILQGRIPSPTLVLMNPPFSSAARQGRKNNLIGGKHIEQALSLLRPGGRLVAIVGNSMQPGSATYRPWFESLKPGYTLRAAVGLRDAPPSGRALAHSHVYAKHGTNFATRVLVFDKIPQGDVAPLMTDVRTLPELMRALEEIRNAPPSLRAGSVEESQGSQQSLTPPGESARESDALAPRPGGQPAVSGTRSEAAGGLAPSRGDGGSGGSPVPPQAEQSTGRPPRGSRRPGAERPAGSQSLRGGPDTPQPAPRSDAGTSGGLSPGTPSVISAEDALAGMTEAEFDTIFDEAAADIRQPKRPPDAPQRPVTPDPTRQAEEALQQKAAASGLQATPAELEAIQRILDGVQEEAEPYGRWLPGVDSQKYLALEPHLRTILARTVEHGGTVKDYFLALLRTFGEPIKPYVNQLRTEIAREANKPERPLGADPRVTVESAVPEANEEELTESVFEAYTPQRLRIEGAKPHVSPLVQSAALASVDPPPVTYQPQLPRTVITEGRLSLPQLEAVVYAGQSHAQMLPAAPGVVAVRRGYMVGDSTGVGKGRTISGIIADNFSQGRTRAIWVSEKAALLQDARRDWRDAINGNPDDIVSLSERFGLRDRIGLPQGILFTTYDTLRGVDRTDKTKTRVAQIVAWLGPDFDGVIAFDESHAMANNVATGQGLNRKNASQRAISGLELQQALPNARIVYVSATGATEVSNLGYLERLGLWGYGTPFPTKHDFINQIAAGGVASMELVARDMKAMGVYLARSLSYEGVEYQRLESPLTPYQQAIYNKMAVAWQMTLTRVEEALGLTGATSGRARAQAVSQFWGSHLRFFNQMLTAMQTPAMLRSIDQFLANPNGDAIVIQIVNTNAAIQDRRLAALEEDQSLDDVSLTPVDILMDYVRNSFPTQQMEEYMDENENLQVRPLRDADGNTVQNPEAVASREALLDDLATLASDIPDGPLEMILDHFGPEMVAEVTGRKQRLVRVPDEQGGTTRVRQLRTEALTRRDADDFMQDRKRILIFSDKGGTGRSYHADLSQPNQRHRQHYILQAGWRADKAIQGLGRTHRTNQASAPTFHLVSTDIPGQKRFISTIARRLDQLGALTKGQRQASTQGLFAERDNLESQYARDALQQYFDDLVRGQNVSMDAQQFQSETGIALFNADGSVRRDPADVERFLNRMLSMTIEAQHLVMDDFNLRIDQKIEQAIQQGTLDIGMETLKADRITKVHEQVIATSPETGETKHVTLRIENKRSPLSYERLQERLQVMAVRGRSSGIGIFRGMVRNKQSGRMYAITTALPRTNTKEGSITEQVRRVSPDGEDLVPKEDIDERYEQIIDRDAQELWDTEVASLPEYRAHETHLLTGTLLPYWDRLPQDASRVIRAQTTTGERYLGRVIPPRQVPKILENFGITTSSSGSQESRQFTAGEVTTEILTQAKRYRLANNWQLRLSRSGGEARIELTGPGSVHRADLQRDGIIFERQGFTPRYFLPSGAGSTAILDRLLQQHPIVAEITGEEESTVGEEVTAYGVEEPPSGYHPEFSQSVVVDENGKLKPVYHGTARMFDAFDLGQKGTAAGQMFDGIFFAEDPSVSARYAEETSRRLSTQKASIDQQGPNVRPVYLNITYPFDMTASITRDEALQLTQSLIDARILRQQDKQDFTRYLSFGKNGAATNREVYEKLSQPYGTTVMLGNINKRFLSNNEVTHILEAVGYDGLYHEGQRDGKVWVAFSPEQIRPVFSNNTPFFEPEASYDKRPDATPATRQLATGALESLERVSTDPLFSLGRGVVARSRALPGEPGPVGTRVLYRRTPSDDYIDGLRKDGRAAFIGQKASTPHDIAVLAQAVRDPRIERLFWIFTQGDTVVAVDAVSSRLPSGSQAFLTPRGAGVDSRTRHIEMLKRRMGRMAADGYYLVHNHPSGNPEPSRADHTMTRAIATDLEGFRGHVVIDHGKYAVLEADTIRTDGPPGLFQTTFHEMPVEAQDPLNPPLPGQMPQVRSPEAIAQLAQTFGQPGVTAFFLDQKNFVRSVQLVPEALFTNGPAFGEYVRGQKRALGAGQVITSAQGTPQVVGEAAKEHYRNGLLLDHLSEGKSVVEGRPFIDRTPMPGYRVAEDELPLLPPQGDEPVTPENMQHDAEYFASPEFPMGALTPLYRSVVGNQRGAVDVVGAMRSLFEQGHDAWAAAVRFTQPRLFELYDADPEFYTAMIKALAARDSAMVASRQKHDALLRILDGDQGKLDLLFKALLADRRAVLMADPTRAEAAERGSLPELTDDELALFGLGPKTGSVEADAPLMAALQYYKDWVQAEMEFYRTDAGIRTQLIGPIFGTYLHVEALDLDKHVPRLAYGPTGAMYRDIPKTGLPKGVGPTAGTTGRIPRALSATRARAALRASGGGEFYNGDPKSLLEGMYIDRYAAAFKNQLVRMMGLRALHPDPRTGRYPASVPFGGKEVPQVRSTVGLKHPHDLQDIHVPKPIEDAWKILIEDGPDYQSWLYKVNNFFVTAAILSPAEGIQHAVNVMGALYAIPGVGTSLGMTGRALAYSPLRYASIIADLYTLQGPEFEQIIQTLATHGALRTSHFGDVGEHLWEDIPYARKIAPALRVLKNIVFDYPGTSRGFWGMEARARAVMYKANRYMYPGITDADNARLVNDAMGTYATKIQPQLVKAMKRGPMFDPFAAAGVALGKTAIKAAFGRGPRGFSLEPLLGTWLFAGVITGILNTWLDPEHRPFWQIPGLKLFDIRVHTPEGQILDLPARTLHPGPARGTTMLGVREMFKQYVDGERSLGEFSSVFLLQQVNNVLGRFGMFPRTMLAAAQGRATYLTRQGELLPMEPKTPEGIDVKERLFSILRAMMPAGATIESFVHELPFLADDSEPERPEQIGEGLSRWLWYVAEVGGWRPAKRPDEKRLATANIRQQRAQDFAFMRDIAGKANRMLGDPDLLSEQEEARRYDRIDRYLERVLRHAWPDDEEKRDTAERQIRQQMRRSFRSINRAFDQLQPTGSDR